MEAWTESNSLRTDYNISDNEDRCQHSQAMVVLILPTLANSASFAKSVPNSGVSSIFSLKTLDARGERTKALTYKSWKVVFDPGGPPCSVRFGSVKTTFGSVKIQWRRSYWRSLRVIGSPSLRFTQYGMVFLCAGWGLGRRDIGGTGQVKRLYKSHDLLLLAKPSFAAT